MKRIFHAIRGVLKRRTAATSRPVRRGQVLVMFVIFLFVLILLIGLGIDVGFAYVTEARLAKAVDAAALTAMRNIYQGQDVAAETATSVFTANYGATGSGGTVNPNITFGFDSDNNPLVNINASASINTIFVSILPEWKLFTVHAAAQATRGRLIMALVLDRSGSMLANGGAAALPTAVSTFIDFFDNDADQVAMASFARNATVDVTMRYQFKDPIKFAVNSMQFLGATFSQGGLSNGYAQIQSVPPQAGTVVRAAIFFTDGRPNAFQETAICPGPATNPYIAGSCYTSVAETCPGCGTYFYDTNGNPPYATVPDYGASSYPCYVATFPSIIDGSQQPFTCATVQAEARARAIATASQMRDAGIVIYSIGLGNTVDTDFLKQIANDPTSSVVNSNQPVGQAVFAPTAADLQRAFYQIAQQVLTRLTK